jgi:hypothetical protein
MNVKRPLISPRLTGRAPHEPSTESQVNGGSKTAPRSFRDCAGLAAFTCSIRLRPRREGRAVAVRGRDWRAGRRNCRPALAGICRRRRPSPRSHVDPISRQWERSPDRLGVTRRRKTSCIITTLSRATSQLVPGLVPIQSHIAPCTSMLAMAPSIKWLNICPAVLCYADGCQDRDQRSDRILSRERRIATHRQLTWSNSHDAAKLV